MTIVNILVCEVFPGEEIPKQVMDNCSLLRSISAEKERWYRRSINCAVLVKIAFNNCTGEGGAAATVAQ